MCKYMYQHDHKYDRNGHESTDSGDKDIGTYWRNKGKGTMYLKEKNIIAWEKLETTKSRAKFS